MRKLCFASLCALLWACLFTSVALAQSEDPRADVMGVPFCGEIPERECAALAATSTVMAGLTSGTTENTMEVYLTGGALGDAALSLRISSENTFVAEPETLTRLVELKNMPPDALMADPAAISELMLLPLSIDIDQTITVAFSPELLEMLSTRFGTTPPVTFSFHTRIIDNVMYIRPADFAAFGAQPQWLPEWVGIRMIGLLSDTVASTMASEDFTTQDLTETQNNLMTPGAALATGVVYYVPPDQISLYADFMHLSPLGTREMDGQQANVYGLTWDIPRYLGGALFAQQTGLSSTYGHPSMVSYLLGTLSVVLLDGLHAQTIQTVGVDDSYLYAVETQVEWALGIPGGARLAERPVLGFRSSTINRDLNAVEAIAPPARATVLPLDQFVNVIRALQQ